MSRFLSALPFRTNLFYNSAIFLVLVVVISLVKCHDETRYAPKDCEKTTKVNATCSTAGQIHTFSEDFFKECQQRIQSYDISLDNPLNPHLMCLVFPDLGSDKKICVKVDDENKNYFLGLAITLILILLLDVVGIGLMIYSCCCQKHPPPPPPPPPENSAKNQPTVILIQAGGAPAAAAPAKKDEEA